MNCLSDSYNFAIEETHEVLATEMQVMTTQVKLIIHSQKLWSKTTVPQT